MALVATVVYSMRYLITMILNDVINQVFFP